MNPLNQYPEVRKYLYLLQWVVNGVLAVAGAYFLIDQTAIEDLPRWYVVTVGIAPVLWTYLGITAQANVTPEPKDDYTTDDHDDALSYEESGGQPFPETPDAPGDLGNEPRLY